MGICLLSNDARCTGFLYAGVDYYAPSQGGGQTYAASGFWAPTLEVQEAFIDLAVGGWLNFQPGLPLTPRASSCLTREKCAPPSCVMAEP